MSPTLWRSVLGELELVISKAHYRTWFYKSNLASITQNEAVISVTSPFIRDWIETHYKDQLIQFFHKHGAPIVDLRFIIAGADNQDQPDIFDNTKDQMVETKKTELVSTERPNGIVASQVFETFVEGANNRLASTVSRAVAKSPGTLYNPLFIYGGVGMGKTHLMHAIANEVIKADPTKQVLYVSCEKFTNDYIASISQKKTDKFKQTYRTCDLLLVDDIQFLANKEGSQEEFFNTFNTLHQSNRQIVLAADRPPKAIPGLEERLSSRFSWGMSVDIQPPNLETRIAILTSKCQEKGVSLPGNALEYIADQVQSNIRELEGALNRVVIYCHMSHVPISLESTRAALSGLVLPTQRKKYSVDSVLHLIAEHFGITLDDLIGRKRHKELVYPRHITMYILREDLHMSFPEIGREIGGKDHTTIIHGYNKIVGEISTNERVPRDLSRIKERLVSL